jgi:carotenoid cleavage dioxygenase-like enzyme
MGSKYLWGKACIAECIQYDGARKRTKVHLIPRPTSRADAAAAAAGRRVFETDPFFSFHHANAFEDAASGRVVIDTVANHDGIDFSANFETVGGWVGGWVGDWASGVDGWGVKSSIPPHSAERPIPCCCAGHQLLG